MNMLGKIITSPIHCRKVWLLISAFVCIPLGLASERDELRIDIGLSIFPRVLAVDTQFKEKLNAENKVHLAFVFSDDLKKAKYLANLMLQKRTNIANVEVLVEAISIDELLKLNTHKYAALFISEKLSDADMEKLVKVSVTQSRILFSPYSGDVERGATIGLMITSRVWPYLNMNTIKEAGIKLNVLLIKYAKRYE